MPLIGYQSFPYPILVTKYCPAGNLRTYLESQNWPSDYKMTLPLLKGIATGLAVLHSKGLAHGNLKLNNVLVDVVGSATPRVKLTDFMIPMMQISPSKSKTDTMSTLRMCPPEYFDDEPWNLAMDVWSFGMLGFVVVSGGEEPYKGVESKIGVGFGDGGDGGEDAGVLSWGVERVNGVGCWLSDSRLHLTPLINRSCERLSKTSDPRNRNTCPRTCGASSSRAGPKFRERDPG